MNKKKNRHKWDKKELKAAYLFTLPSFIYRCQIFNCSEKYFMVHHMLFIGKYSNRTYFGCAG